MRFVPTLLTALVATFASGCATPDGDTPQEKRDYTLDVRKEALAELYAENPGAKAEADAAAGTFFLSGFSLHPGLLTVANGYGVVENNATGEKTYVRLGRFGVGPGISVKGYYLFVMIDDEETLHELEEGGYFGGAFAEASFELGFGGSAAATAVFNDAVHGYIWTHTGVALELTLAFSHIGGEDELN